MWKKFLHEAKLLKAEWRILLLMELPKDVLGILELFWADEYESDYWRFIEDEKPAQTPAKASLDSKEMAAISTV